MTEFEGAPKIQEFRGGWFKGTDTPQENFIRLTEAVVGEFERLHRCRIDSVAPEVNMGALTAPDPVVPAGDAEYQEFAKRTQDTLAGQLDLAVKFMSVVRAKLEQAGVLVVDADRPTDEQSALLKNFTDSKNPLAGLITRMIANLEPTWRAAAALRGDPEGQDKEAGDRGWCLALTRTTLAAFTDEGGFAHRARFQPEGWPGDATLMRMMVNREVTGRTLLGLFTDQFLLHSSAAVSHDDKHALMARMYGATIDSANGAPVTLVSIASGAWTVGSRHLIPQSGERSLANLQVYLFDVDEGALAQATAALSEAAQAAYGERASSNSPKLSTAFFNAYKTLGGPADGINFTDRPQLPGLSGRADIAEQDGYFDYFNKAIIAASVARSLDVVAKPGGRYVATFVWNGHPARGLRSMLLNWDLPGAQSVEGAHEIVGLVADIAQRAKTLPGSPLSGFTAPTFRDDLATPDGLVTSFDTMRPDTLRPGEYTISRTPMGPGIGGRVILVINPPEPASQAAAVV